MTIESKFDAINGDGMISEFALGDAKYGYGSIYIIIGKYNQFAFTFLSYDLVLIKCG